jgi:hypothetical protein
MCVYWYALLNCNVCVLFGISQLHIMHARTLAQARSHMTTHILTCCSLLSPRHLLVCDNETCTELTGGGSGSGRFCSRSCAASSASRRRRGGGRDRRVDPGAAARAAAASTAAANAARRAHAEGRGVTCENCTWVEQTPSQNWSQMCLFVMCLSNVLTCQFTHTNTHENTILAYSTMAVWAAVGFALARVHPNSRYVVRALL